MNFRRVSLTALALCAACMLLSVDAARRLHADEEVTDDPEVADEVADDPESTAGDNVVDVLTNDPDLSTLVAAVTAADEDYEPDFDRLAAALTGEDEITVFAPNNAAFTALLDTFCMTLDDIVADKDMLRQIIQYHVASGEFMKEDLTGEAPPGEPTAEVITFDGDDPIIVMPADEETGAVQICAFSMADNGACPTGGGALVIDVDLDASNGVVHTIDGVLLQKVVYDKLTEWKDANPAGCANSGP